MSILDGQYKNRKLFDHINIDNPNQKCVEIGLSCLSALGKSLGIAKLSDSAQLVNGVCVAHVKVRDEQNVVRTYSKVDSPVATTATGQAVVGTAPQASQDGQNVASVSKPPWAR